MLIYHCIFKIQSIKHGENFKLKYEFRESEFSKPSFIDGGAFGDRHIIEIQINFQYPIRIKKLVIQERNYFKRLLIPNSKTKYKVKCNIKDLESKLMELDCLEKIFYCVEESPELSPSFEFSNLNEKYYRFKIYYNTQKPNMEVFNSFIKFGEYMIDSSHLEIFKSNCYY